MKIQWIRGNDYISYNHPFTWMGIGIRGSGKSSLIEHIGEQYINEGHTIVDLFGSRDGEGLAWLRSPLADDKKILIVHGDSAKVACEHDTRTVEKLRVKDFETYDIIISSSPLYASVDEEFYQSAKLTDKIYSRRSYKRLIYCIVREAANLYYSRLKIRDSQTQAKAEMAYLIREARHMGMAMGIDTLRFYAIDIDIRSLADFLFLKALGIPGLPHDLGFLYSMINPMTFRHLKPEQFIVISKSGSVGYGTFPEIPWHKKEKENILKQVGIEVAFEEAPLRGADKGSFHTLGDLDHAELIRIYVEEGIGQEKVAERLSYSPATVHSHIKEHNYNVDTVSFCHKCRRAKSIYGDSIARRGSHKNL